MKVKVQDTSDIITYQSDLELVEKIRALSFDKSKSLHDFMVDYSRRCALYNSDEIRSNTIENFVSDLLKYGLLIIQ